MSDAETVVGEDAPRNQETELWYPTIERVRQAAMADDDAALIALDDELRTLSEQPRKQIRRVLPLIPLYRSLITWKREGRFVTPFDDAKSGQIQFWELDEYCGDLEYKRKLVKAATTRYSEKRGFRMFERILATIGESVSRFKPDKSDIQIYRRPGATMTLIAFGGVKGGFAGIGWMMLDRAVAEPLNANLIALRDTNKRVYLAGIQSVGDYPASVARIREIVAEFADTRIITIGASAGVFGAINVAADLGVRQVIAFAGPTSIEVGEQNDDRQVWKQIVADIEAGRMEHVDLAEKVKNSAIERIDFFAAGKHEFDMAHLHAIMDRNEAVVVPHVYADLDDHVVTDFAIADGTLMEAFAAGPKTPGLA